MIASTSDIYRIDCYNISDVRSAKVSKDLKTKKEKKRQDERQPNIREDKVHHEIFVKLKLVAVLSLKKGLITYSA